MTYELSREELPKDVQIFKKHIRFLFVLIQKLIWESFKLVFEQGGAVEKTLRPKPSIVSKPLKYVRKISKRAFA